MKSRNSRPSTGQKTEKEARAASTADLGKPLRETPAGNCRNQTICGESGLSETGCSGLSEAPACGPEALPEGRKRMLVKVCGLREAENIRRISRLDVDWIGFIFYPRSPRYLLRDLPCGSAEETERLIADLFPAAPDEPWGFGQRGGQSFPDRRDSLSLPAACGQSPAQFANREGRVWPAPRRVGVFVDESVERIRRIADMFRLDYLQLHGRETPDECYALQKRGYSVIKAFSVESAADLLRTEPYEGRADYFLFDTRCEGYGGSGRRFDWDLLSAYAGATPFLLSGGIGPDSLDALRSFRHPRMAGIDLNSAFESSPGRKDVDKLARFIGAFRAV